LSVGGKALTTEDTEVTWDHGTLNQSLLKGAWLKRQKGAFAARQFADEERALPLST